MRVLLVEDDAMLGAGMKRALEKAGYLVDWALTGDEAVAAMAARAYTVALLDLALPEMSGMAVLRTIRDQKDITPVIIITASGRAQQKVEGLDAGADDYLVKPFDLDELLARIRAQTRRREGRANDMLHAQNVSVELGARLVRQDDQIVAVTAKELRILTALLKRAGQFVSKSELEDVLYDADSDIDSNTIEVTIYGLRKKLGAGFIVTARGLGYMTPR